MDHAELEALLKQARAGERMASSLEDAKAEVAALRGEVSALRTEIGKLRGTADRLSAWLDREQALAHAASKRGPLAWLAGVLDDPKVRTLVTAALAAAATAFVNWTMASAGVEPPANQPPGQHAPATP